ncbi:hypothetical protein HLB23_15835 [Nocardia uniformis]|uniref:Uncharacterized protein n=1 Tax=Nocardia uniformis TaxID=53432 RepID=A0A849C4P8_9NOCA|nr:hypothetical protein [Nocardia uniformis]NNH71315.1 hypothetical protein [Nocardia uniformis]
MTTRRTRVAGVVLAIVSALLAGCVVEGNPRPATPELSALDVGYYSIDPLSEPSERNEQYGRVVESVRMGEATIDPAEADSSLVFGPKAIGAQPIPTPVKATGVLSAPAREVLAKRGMLAGFATTGMDRESSEPVVGSSRLLSIILLRFPDAESARQAATEIDAVDTGVSTENVAVAIPGYPEAHAHWRPTVPTMAATMAQDSFVISLLVGHTSTDLTAMAALAGRALGAQRTRLSDFRATAVGDIAALPVDRDGMLRRMVNEHPGRWPYPQVLQVGTGDNAGWDSSIWVSGVVYGPHAVFLRGPRPGTQRTEAEAFIGQARLHRFPSASMARREYEENFRIGGGLREIPGPNGVPDAKCVQNLASAESVTNYACWVLSGRYVAIYYGRDETHTRQKVAAQFILLQRDPA